MSMATTKEQQQQQQQQQQRYPYPLIDVDCNLLHPDLMNKTLLVPTVPSVAKTPCPSNEQDEDHHKTPQPQQPQPQTTQQDELSPLGWILDHPSTVLSNIQGIFSPSSTLEEAELMYDLLSQREIIMARMEKNKKKNNKCKKDERQHDDNDDDNDEEEEEKKKSPVSNTIDIRMSVGVHPYHTSGGSSIISFEKYNHRIRQLIQRDHAQKHHHDGGGCGGGGAKFITCIGETGLDYSEGFPCREDQIPWFRNQLELAKEYNLPLFLHERLAFDDTVRLMDEVFGQQSSTSSSEKVIVHCFTGSKKECIEYVKRGYYLSVSGYICKSGEGPRQVQECLMDGIIPMEKLMIETDAPYMGFASCRDLFYQAESSDMNGGVALDQLSNKMKKRYLKGIYPNVPCSLPMVLERTVNLINEGRRQRGEDNDIGLEDAAKMFHDNAVEFFGFPK